MNKPKNDIIDLVEDDESRKNTRREGHVEEQMDEICPVTTGSQRNIRLDVNMDTVQLTSTKSSERPSVYDSRTRKDEDDDLQAMENSSGALKYYAPQAR